MSEDNNYKIYIHINKFNNKCYIGQTKMKPSKRWGAGGGYKYSPKFYSAILKYGWDNFHHIVFIEHLTLYEANELECYYINLFDSINNGYNIDIGGNNFMRNNDTRGKISYVKHSIIHAYDERGTVSYHFLNSLDLESSGFNYRQVTSAIEHGYLYNGLLWERISKPNEEIIAINILDKTILTFSNISEATKEGFHYGAIQSCLLNEICQHSGYIWKFKHLIDDESLKAIIENISIKELIKEQAIIGINIFTESIIEYTSIKSANNDGFDSAGISMVINDKRIHHKGYIWRRSIDYNETDMIALLTTLKDDIDSIKKHIRGRIIIQTNISDGTIVEFDSIKSASDAGFDRNMVAKCCKGIYKKYNGYTWQYKYP